MRMAVTGSTGQLARALARRAAGAGVTLLPLARPDFDLEQDDGIANAIVAAAPDIVVNAAAYTAVDRAESEPERAFAINGHGAGLVASAAHMIGVPVIQISTDYVFDGSGDQPWQEEDRTAPVNLYGASKLAGEQAVAKANPRHAILRTSWVYAAEGANFLRTMLRLAAAQDKVRVVQDQTGAPTLADDLADAVLTVAKRLRRDVDDPKLTGIFHVTGAGHCNWAGFATEIFRLSGIRGGPVAQVMPIPARDYPTPARRPGNSRLDCRKIAAVHGVEMPEWHSALARCMDEVAQLEQWRAT